jgi:A/G-specific adenine glycosylase
VTQVVEAAIAIRRNGRYLLRQRQPNERWAGLWDFPRFELSRGAESATLGDINAVRAELSRRLEEITGLNSSVETLVTQFSHSVTRYRIRLLCFEAACRSGMVLRTETWQWVRPAEFGKVALSVSGRRFAGMLGKSFTDQT